MLTTKPYYWDVNLTSIEKHLDIDDKLSVAWLEDGFWHFLAQDGSQEIMLPGADVIKMQGFLKKKKPRRASS